MVCLNYVELQLCKNTKHVPAELQPPARKSKLEEVFYSAGQPEWPIAAAEAIFLCRFSTPSPK